MASRIPIKDSRHTTGSHHPPKAILFDLDGTLADTAPDLAAAANWLRTTQGLPPASYELLRPHASAGARGLLGAAFGLLPTDTEFEALRIAFLDHYEANLVVQSRLFDGIEALLSELDTAHISWGIVTNKATRFTEPLVPRIGLRHAACVISGDTTPYAKPHPGSLLEAARCLSLKPSECWYVGDDLRDIQAGQAAGMHTVAAAWGYCGTSDPISWGAHAIAMTPSDLLKQIQIGSKEILRTVKPI